MHWLAKHAGNWGSPSAAETRIPINTANGGKRSCGTETLVKDIAQGVKVQQVCQVAIL